METNLNEMRDATGDEQQDVAGGAAHSCTSSFSWGGCWDGFFEGSKSESGGLLHETTHAK